MKILNPLDLLTIAGGAYIVFVLIEGTWFLFIRPLFKRENTMPVAVATDVAELKYLKTLPADPSVEGPAGEAGWVKLRRMTYGEKMSRRSFNSKMTVKTGGRKKDAETIIDAFNERTELFDFANCIVDHNLTDAQGVKLDFRNEAHVRSLAGHVAEEIQTLMDELNNFEQDDEAGNS